MSEQKIGTVEIALLQAPRLGRVSIRGPIRDRLLSLVDRRPGGCWVWSGSKQRTGYGQVAWQNIKWRAHRLFYSVFVGPIPAGLQTDHLCRNRACVRPSHLEFVTSAENTARGESPSAVNARKTHCPKGHKFDGGGVRRRWCKTCGRDRMRARRAA